MTGGLVLKRADWNHVMAWATIFAMLGTGRVWAGTNAWKSIGPQGGEIKTLSVDSRNPRTIYAATVYGGAFKSLDGGANWIKSDVPDTPLVFDPQAPNTIYAIDASGPKGISKSTDGGTSWTPANTGLASVEVIALAIDPLDPSTLYAGTTQGIFKSTDGASNWSSTSSGIPLLNSLPGQPGPPRPTSVYSLVIDPQNPGTLYAVANGMAVISGSGLTVYATGGLVKSTDGGGSWNTVDLDLPQSHTIDAVLAIDPQNPSTLYVGTVYGILKSTDGGAGWIPMNSGLPPFETGLPPFLSGSAYFLVNSILIDPQLPDTVYAAITNSSGSRIFKTTNGGASWHEAASGLPEGTFVSSLQIDLQTPTTLYAGTGVGVFKSTDGGTSWGRANSGLNAVLITDVVIDPRNSNTLYAVTSSGLRKSTDRGAHWSPVHSDLAGSFSLAIDPQTTSTLFAPGCIAGSVIRTCGVLKSMDGGANWSLSWNAGDSYSNWVTALAVDPQNSNVVYATTQEFDECGLETLRKSMDGGLTWTSSLFKDLGVSADCSLELAIDPQTPTNLYAVFQYGGVFKSTDGGITWSAINSGLTPDGVYNGAPLHKAVALAIDQARPSTVYTVSFSGVFKSSDGGMSWNPASSGLPDWSSELGDCCFRPRLVVDPQNSARVYLGIALDGAHHVFQSSDGGTSWIDSGLSVSGGGLWFGGLAISSQDPSTVYAGSPGQGVFAFTNAVH